VLYMLTWDTSNPTLGSSDTLNNHGPETLHISQDTAIWLLFLVWGIGEVIRYPFYILTVSEVQPPYVLTWARYSIPLLLMPIGFAAELWLLYVYSQELRGTFQGTFLWGYMFLYLGGPAILLKGVWKSRGKKLGSNKSKKN